MVKKTKYQLAEETKALIRADAKRKRDNINQSQFELDRYTAKSPEYNRWGYPTGR